MSKDIGATYSAASWAMRDNWVNGNRKDVINELRAMPPLHAAYMALEVNSMLLLPLDQVSFRNYIHRLDADATRGVLL